jgi:Putative lysophospholipase.
MTLRRRMLRLLIFFVVAAVLLKLLVWWAEPRMAFFPFKGVQETPAILGVAFSDHRIPTADGETLHAWWFEHATPRAQIVYWHGNGGNLSLWMPVFVDLHRRGFNVLAVDYRGYGESTGRASEQGIYRDGEAATAYFAQRLRKQGIRTIYWGRSLGCAVASYTAAKTAPDALVLEAPFPDVAFLFARNPVMRVMSIFSTYSFPTSQHLEHYAGPLLVVHGDADSIIPSRAGQRVFEQAPTKAKTFVALPGADHNDVFADRSDYASIIDRFVSNIPAAGR